MLLGVQYPDTADKKSINWLQYRNRGVQIERSNKQACPTLQISCPEFIQPQLHWATWYSQDALGSTLKGSSSDNSFFFIPTFSYSGSQVHAYPCVCLSTTGRPKTHYFRNFENIVYGHYLLKETKLLEIKVLSFFRLLKYERIIYL